MTSFWAGPPSRLVEDSALAIALSGLALVPPPAGPGRARTAYRAALSGLVGAYTGRSVRDLPVPPGTQLALGLAATTAGWAFADTTESWDRRSDDALRRAGVRRPREVFSALLAAGLLAVALVEHRTRNWSTTAGCLDAPEVLTHLDSSVLRVIADVLSGYDGLGAPELRRQLAVARQVRHAPGEAPTGWVQLSVPPDAPRVFPSEFVFPVGARSTSRTGVQLTTRLIIAGGVLSSFEIVPLDRLDDDDREHPAPNCAELSSWTLVLDDPRGPVGGTGEV